jgi:hypothetical protein
MLIYKIFRRYFSKKLAHEILGNIPKNNSIVLAKKPTFIEKVEHFIDNSLDNIEVFLNAIDEVYDEEELQNGGLPLSDKGNSILKSRYEYTPSIIPHEVYLKYKKPLAPKNSTEYWFSDTSTQKTHTSNFEASDTRFGGSIIAEGAKNGTMKVVDFKPEIHLLKTLGYLSHDEQTFYPMLQPGNLVKIVKEISAYKPPSYLHNLFGPAWPDEKITLIDEKDPTWKLNPLPRNLEPGEVLMYLGFRKVKTIKEKPEPNMQKGFYPIPTAYIENLYELKGTYTADWIVDGKIISAIFLITYLEKIEEND